MEGRNFLSVFGLDSLRDLPDVEALEDAGLLGPGQADPMTDHELPEFYHAGDEGDD